MAAQKGWAEAQPEKPTQSLGPQTAFHVVGECTVVGSYFLWSFKGSEAFIAINYDSINASALKFNKQVQMRRGPNCWSVVEPSSTSPLQTQKHFSNKIELQFPVELNTVTWAKITLYANELVYCSSWGCPLMGMGKAAEPDVWPCPCCCVALCRPPPAYLPPLSSTGTASLQAYVFFALTYHNSCFLLPWLLIFLLSFILQCRARVILLGVIWYLTSTHDSALLSGWGPPHTWLNPLL